MTAFHRIIGFAVLAAATLVALAGVGAKLARRHPGRRFEAAAAGVLALAGLQLGAGIVLLAIGHRPPTKIHYLYGVLVPVVMALGVGLARALRRDRWVVLAWACFLVALLALRAIMTGSR
jgi:hypothetical protein